MVNKADLKRRKEKKKRNAFEHISQMDTTKHLTREIKRKVKIRYKFMEALQAWNKPEE